MKKLETTFEDKKLTSIDKKNGRPSVIKCKNEYVVEKNKMA